MLKLKGKIISNRTMMNSEMQERNNKMQKSIKTTIKYSKINPILIKLFLLLTLCMSH